MTIKRIFIALALTLLNISLFGQITFPRNGVYDERDNEYAFTKATIHTTFNQSFENATLLIKNGKIVAVGKSVKIPSTAVEIDLEGKHIYPSFIDPYSSYGMPDIKKKKNSGGWGTQQMISKTPGAYSWNEALRPEFRAHEVFTPDDKEAEKLRKIGFGTLSIHRPDGLSRGSATVVSLAKDRAHQLILKEKAAHHLSFKKGSSSQSYPGSLMGGIALFKQTYHDAQWYKNQDRETNLSLQAWNEIQNLPQIFDTRDVLESLRAIKLGQGFDKEYVIYGNGDEYKRIDALRAANTQFILTLNFPKPFDVSEAFTALRVELSDMKHWELAPKNPYYLAQANIPFSFTADGLKDKGKFLTNIRKAIEAGLSEEQALKAITYTPAQLLGIYDKVGSLEKGKIANFIISSKPIFEKESKIHHNWIQGKPYVFSNPSAPELSGQYRLNVQNQTYVLEAKDDGDMKIIINDSTQLKLNSSYKDGMIHLHFPYQKGAEKSLRLSGLVQDGKWNGNGYNQAGEWVSWNALRMGDLEKKEEDKKKEEEESKKEEGGKIIYPFLAYGNETLARPENVLIRNATVWTNEKEGIVKETDIWINNGKIQAVGKNITAPGASIIDGTGKHVTSGIIDEHSHIAISRGVNECTQSSTAEVSIGDVVNSEDVNIYRQLSGGVTISQLLHGSCNPIGGKSAIIKLKWGYLPEEMKIDNAPKFIKFALGENVKKSRAPINNRFPDTRMGVEQVYKDAFTRAKEYESSKNSADFRKDLDLETLVEILNGERHISCHSYVQSEINMLMKVADEMGFKVNTFTHILEGYKVADKMKAHGAGGSSFSDWWAYKYEVIDAIPYNGAIMHEQGITVAFNSDDAEMARRLNQEAAKAVKYGNVPEEEAWKFVTLNPAKLLHLDDRVGSLKKGKDADVVVWSDHPMSIYAKAEQTFIDGIRFWDVEKDIEKRKAIAKERNRLINKMIAAKNGGSPTRPVSGKSHHHYHCDDAADEMVD